MKAILHVAKDRRLVASRAIVSKIEGVSSRQVQPGEAGIHQHSEQRDLVGECRCWQSHAVSKVPREERRLSFFTLGPTLA